MRLLDSAARFHLIDLEILCDPKRTHSDTRGVRYMHMQGSFTHTYVEVLVLFKGLLPMRKGLHSRDAEIAVSTGSVPVARKLPGRNRAETNYRYEPISILSEAKLTEVQTQTE